MTNQSIALKESYFSVIDGLRGIAILMILTVHTSQAAGNEHIGSFTIIALVPYYCANLS